MSTTVRIASEDKARLDRLQAKLALARDRRFSLDEVLHHVLVFAERNERDLLEEDKGPNLTEEEIEELMGLSMDLGFETDATKVDEYLYDAFLEEHGAPP